MDKTCMVHQKFRGSLGELVFSMHPQSSCCGSRVENEAKPLPATCVFLRLLGASVLALPVRYAPASVPVMSPFAFDLHKLINGLLDWLVASDWC
jgi:hypothetical protein